MNELITLLVVMGILAGMIAAALAWKDVKVRLAPFLVLLEARYAPLLFAVAPQSYNVYLWLYNNSDRSLASFWFAVIGALGYESIYVGAIAWAEEGDAGWWTWGTAGIALLFSVAVAVFVHIEQGYWSLLHAGFPLVSFCYTMQLHSLSGGSHSKHAPTAVPAAPSATKVGTAPVDTVTDADSPTAVPVKRTRKPDKTSAVDTVDTSADTPDILRLRASGLSFEAIGRALGMSRQSAYQKYVKLTRKPV